MRLSIAALLLLPAAPVVCGFSLRLPAPTVTAGGSCASHGLQHGHCRLLSPLTYGPATLAPAAALLTTTTTALRAEAAAAGGSESAKSAAIPPGTATIPQEIFNLVKAIVGAGVLTLPAGIAAFGTARSAVLPANLLIALVGLLSAYGFGLIGRVCSLTKTSSYRGAWEATVGEKSSWVPAWSVTLKTLFATLAYSMILGDTVFSLVGGGTSGAGSSLGGALLATKPRTLAALTTAVLLPLCLLKDLSSLAPFSLLGVLGMAYTAAAMGFRYHTGAYAAPAGALLKAVPAALRPRFGGVGAAGALTPRVGILLGMLSTAYMAHFNAPKFYVELKDNTVPRYLTVVAASFGASVALFGLMASWGFLTFGGASSGLILNNYAATDKLMGLSRAAVALAIVGSYPLAFAGARDGVLDLLQVAPARRTPGLLNSLTVGLLAALTGAALAVPDVSFVLSFAGATLGNALIYVYPALMFRAAVAKLPQPTRLQRLERRAAPLLALLGAGLGAMGAVQAVRAVL